MTRPSIRYLLWASVVGTALLLAPGSALATTGPTQFLKKSHYKVAHKYEVPYVGQYILKKVDRKARLSGGALGMEINDQGYLYGVGQFYGYDNKGYQDSWVATLYNYRLGRNHEMIIDILGPTGHPLLGRLLVKRARNGDLSGKIQLGAAKYAITWHKISNR